MELLELKSVWDTIINQTTIKEQFTEFEVANTIKRDSKNTLSKIKRVMLFKFIIGGLTLVISMLMLIGTFIIPEKVNFFEEFFNTNENRIFLLSIIIFIGFMLAANYKPFLEIRQFNRSSENIKNSLKKFIGIMEKTIKLNIYSGSIINSSLFTWVFYAVAFKTEPVAWNLKGVSVIAVLSITFGLFYLLGKYEQKIKFGKHLKKLKSCLKEIEEK